MTTSRMYQDRPWLTKYDADVKENLSYEARCMPEFLKQTSARFPDRMALLFQGYKITYRKLDQMVDQCTSALSNAGIKKGDSVAILLPNLIPCVAAYYAVLKIGAIGVMNNPLYSDRELEHQLYDSQSVMLV